MVIALSEPASCPTTHLAKTTATSAADQVMTKTPAQIPSRPKSQTRVASQKTVKGAASCRYSPIHRAKAGLQPLQHRSVHEQDDVGVLDERRDPQVMGTGGHDG